MDKTTVLSIIAEFKTALHHLGIKPQQIILYGSYAVGCPHEGSDIDLVVISEDFKHHDYWQRIDLLSRAIYEVFQPIEAVAMTPREWASGDSLIADYARNGEVI